VPTVVLGITGSVAAYRAADLARDLMRAGFTVRACLTEGAQEFVQPALFDCPAGIVRSSHRATGVAVGL